MSTASGDPYTNLSRVTGLLGDDFLRYVLSIPGDQPVDQAELSPERQRVLDILVQQAMPDGIGTSAALDTYMRVSRLSARVPNADTSLVNLFRTMTGGHIEVADATGDKLVDAIISIARDVWPIYLVHPASQDGPRTFWISLPIGIYNHPAYPTSIDAFIADPRLMKLFPHPPVFEGPEGDVFSKASAYNSLVVASNGHGGSLQLAGLLPNLLSNAIFRCLIAEGSLSLASLTPHIVTATEDLRRLADGEVVRVPALIGFSGVRLPEDPPLELADGRLRPSNDADRSLFMAGATSLTTVFETNYPLRIFAVEEHKFDDEDDPFASFSKFQTRISESMRSFDHTIDLTRLALYLASASETPWLAREVARYVPDPLSPGGTSSWDPALAAVPTHELRIHDFDRVRDWNTLVRSKHVRSLDIGMRRLLAASTVRTDPIDAFVDAVVCWENMFGVQTETTFRVTASIAKLLAPADVLKREALQKELKDLYAKRSRLVHGGGEPKPEETADLRERAIRVAADCFRTLYRDRADLLELPSDARGKRVLLE